MNAKSKGYERPKIKKQETMVFVLRGIAKNDKALACRQCSSCHGCR